MKTKILIIIILLTSSFLSLGINLFESKNSPILPPPQPDNGFIVGVLDGAWDVNYLYLQDSLKLNTWHKLTHPNSGWLKIGVGVDPLDVWNGSPQDIEDRVTYWTDINNPKGLRTLMDRPIIAYLSYGQRSDYQAEATHEDGDYWFYTYETSVNNSVNVNDAIDPVYGNKGKHCVPDASQGAMSSGYILSGLKANREQANKLWNDYQSDSMYTWYVKPRIRIDSAFGNNPANYNTTVCKIDVLNWDGDTIKRADIKVRNFKQAFDSVYNGQYLDEFYFTTLDWSDTSNLKINDGNDLCPGPGREFWNWGGETIDTDFRVHWYGTCEMWIDYVRVENEPSRFLHSTDPSEKAFVTSRISNEVNFALEGYNSSDPRPNNFFIDEFEFNITPSLKRVNHLIDSVSGGKLSLMVTLNYELYNGVKPFYFPLSFPNSDLGTL